MSAQKFESSSGLLVLVAVGISSAYRTRTEAKPYRVLDNLVPEFLRAVVAENVQIQPSSERGYPIIKVAQHIDLDEPFEGCEFVAAVGVAILENLHQNLPRLHTFAAREESELIRSSECLACITRFMHLVVDKHGGTEKRSSKLLSDVFRRARRPLGQDAINDSPYGRRSEQTIGKDSRIQEAL